ncbi:SCP2 sterol-binding domain-containing protein [Palleronia sp. LCG004]|uniref:SCP2 sterol-binding domain-containing protein n=1 Tax=Palleronia sp. LCG004 TaxID=3079304 RepID=UPI0029424C0D|nr:SCP2 sterol-binding domain-containing protein [Palleronia sp. LCG004]WOI57289.1 SCP2 sterol-binding domain-containing protein [Palleronia sp. LCG004]
MSAVIDEAVKQLNEKTGGSYDGSAKFVIQDEGTIMLDHDGARAADETSDVTLTADADTFRSILNGETNPTTAFMTGKLKVDGDMGQAMKLASVL